ncbi:hypothetical protein CAPTEDRAFT_150741 [Capitella teleta]|uniref:NADP-dependent oxidoreductase domain-containing protein n=1 Tax=Capitella teleta TaxID=283909 RepID=R7T682_CAPTE|nr:hypothetical protein CAPTEDRAFT_150741 [Capitella teleta]|eukprot:ELT89044.1 hypothetical protein CAPTEDRAFT_150741 [Capitella teleta]
MPQTESQATSSTMEYRRLGETDMHVSTLSFGGSAVGGVFGNTDFEESKKVVHEALNAGINYIDTAPWYGQGKSESVLGQALWGVPRNMFYVSTKVGRYEPRVEKMFDFSAQKTIQSVDESLARLRLDYIDIVQVHDMEFAPDVRVILNETLPALQKIKESGKCRYIGVTGYPLSNFREVIEKSAVKIDSILTYCRYSMNDNTLKDHIPYFRKHGVGVISASPLSMGLLTSSLPPAWHPAQPRVKRACREAAKYAETRGVDIATLAVQYSLGNKEVDTTLLSAATREILQKNINTVTSSPSDLERKVSQEIMDKFMKPLKNMNWEGIEARNYWNELRCLGNTNSSA